MYALDGTLSNFEDARENIAKDKLSQYLFI